MIVRETKLEVLVQTICPIGVENMMMRISTQPKCVAHVEEGKVNSNNLIYL